MKSTIRNDTRYEVRLKEGNAGIFRIRDSITPGGKYILKHDGNATYREYLILVGPVSGDAHVFSSDDLLDWSEVTLLEGPDGDIKWVGTKLQDSSQTYKPALNLSKDVSFKFDEASSSCNDLKELCERVKICRHQCNHLLQTYQEGIKKMAQLYSHLIENGGEIVKHYRDDRLTKLEKSLYSLEYIVCDAKDMLGSCANELGKVALVVSIRRPPVEKDMEVYSDFDLLIRELEWHLDVIEYLLGPLGHAKFEWSPTMCRYVLAQKKAPDHEKPRSFARMDYDELQSGLRDGSISIPNTIHDTILKRWKAQDRQSRPMNLGAFKIDHLDLQYTLDGKLGEGSFKVVYEGKWYGQTVAIATIRLYDPYDPQVSLKLSKVFKDEVNELLQLQHPKVVSLFGWTETTDAPAPIKEPGEENVHGGYVVTEKMEYNLDKLIEERKSDRSRTDSGPFSYSVGIDILLQIVEAMLHVHNRGVMHRDLKPGNFLVNPRSSPARPGADTYYNLKLIDFGSSKVYVREDGNTYNRGTTLYGAPEMMKGLQREADEGKYGCAMNCYQVITGIKPKKGTSGGKYGMSVDVFSFAMTCYQVITGRKPFQGTDAAAAIKNKKRPEFLYVVLPDLRKLTEECWNENPEKRPSFKEIQKRLWTIKMKLAVE